MKNYPKIEYHNKGLFGEYCYAFDKLDGSQIRIEYSRKRGWYKFGTRNVMIDRNSKPFGDSIDIFFNKYSDDLIKIFNTNKLYRNIDNFVIFAEYIGKNSFAGQHIETDTKDVILFDISQYKRGFIPPREFIENFGDLHIPNIIYKGEYNNDLINTIKSSDSLKEGVVCKGIFKTKGSDQIWMTKIKTNDWLNKVKVKFGDKYLLEELNNDKTLL